MARARTLRERRVQFSRWSLLSGLLQGMASRDGLRLGRRGVQPSHAAGGGGGGGGAGTCLSGGGGEGVQGGPE